MRYQKKIVFSKNIQPLKLICQPNFTIKVGEPVDIILKKNEEQNLSYSNENSLFYATYVISEIKHTLINNSFFTTITVCKDMIKSIDPAISLDSAKINSTNFLSIS